MYYNKLKTSFKEGVIELQKIQKQFFIDAYTELNEQEENQYEYTVDKIYNNLRGMK